jgi:hypothetical protein
MSGTLTKKICELTLVAGGFFVFGLVLAWKVSPARMAEWLRIDKYVIPSKSAWDLVVRNHLHGTFIAVNNYQRSNGRAPQDFAELVAGGFAPPNCDKVPLPKRQSLQLFWIKDYQTEHSPKTLIQSECFRQDGKLYQFVLFRDGSIAMLAAN